MSDKDHPYREPRLIYDGLLGVLRRDADHLEEHLKWSGGQRSERELDAICDNIARDLSQVAHVFSLVDRVDSARIPFQILRALAWAAEALVGTQFRMVVRLDPIMNYSVVQTRKVFESCVWHEQWRSAREKFKLEEQEILLLGIPSAYAKSILLNALAAHEMGHLLSEARTESVSEMVEGVYHVVRRRHEDRLQDYAAQAMGRRQAGEIPDAYGRSSEGVRRLAFSTAMSWCIEVYADLVGVRLLGPAFLAAFDRVLIGKQEPSVSHPPNALRRSLISEYVSERVPAARESEAWKSLVRGERQAWWRGDAVWAFAEDVCRAVAKPFGESLASVSSPLDVEPSEFAEIIESMQEHIKNLSPPSVVLRDRGKWLDHIGFWAILYAGWQFRLDEGRFGAFAKRYCRNDSRNDPMVEAEEALGNVVLQALKSLELGIRWKEWQMERRG